jgi:hypothetical protein
MASSGDYLATIRAIKGVREIYFYKKLKLLYSYPKEPPEVLMTAIKTFLPSLSQRHLHDSEKPQGVDMYLSDSRMNIYAFNGISLIVGCSHQTDMTVVRLASNIVIRDYCQNGTLGWWKRLLGMSRQ